MASHTTPAGESLTIADDLLQLVADSPLVTAQDPEPFQGLHASWFRVTGPDGGTYYVTVSAARPDATE